MEKVMKNAILIFVSSLVLYVSMACSAGGSAGGFNSTGGLTSNAGTTGSISGGGSGGVGGLSVLNPVPSADAAISGSRLKARFRISSDGSKEYLPGEWYDSVRQENCSIVNDKNGIQRCLPIGDAMGSPPTAYYSDSSCTLGVAVTNCYQNKKYIATIGYTTICLSNYGNTWQIYEIGEQITVYEIYQKSGTSCIQTQLPAGYYIYSIGAEIDPSEFVSFSEGHE